MADFQHDRLQDGTEGAARWLLAGIALIALATIFFEVLLTRLFAVTLWYHFGFFAISLALMGTATAAVLCFVMPERLAGASHRRVLQACACAFAVTVPLAVWVHLHTSLPGLGVGLAFYAAFALQIVLFFIPFVFSGLCISISLYRYAAKINTVYAFDLAGAAAGSLLVVPLLFRLSGPSLVFFVSATAMVAAACYARTAFPSRAASIAGVAVFGALVFLNDSLGILAIERVKSYDPGEIQAAETTPVYEKWSPVSRVAVYPPKRPGPNESMQVTADAGAPTVLRKFDGDFSKIDTVKRDSRQAVHALRHDADVLVIGSAGGQDVIAALSANQKHVTAVEINPVTVDLVTNRFADYIGNVFSDPRVTLHLQEGRNFAAGSTDLYDVIQITMIDSWAGAAAGAYIFNENSLYTVDAIEDYLEHLKPGGILSMTRYLDWDEVLRLTNTMIEELQEDGVANIPGRLVVIAEPKKGFHRATVLLKNGIFTEDEVATLKALRATNHSTIVHAPFTADAEFDATPAAKNVRVVINLMESAAARAALLATYPANISPTTDDRPYFFFTSHLRDAFNPPPSQHAARRLAMPILYSMLGLFSLLAVFTVFIPLQLHSGKAIRQVPNRIRFMTYFAMLGMGYMLVEISMIQRLTVFLGHPTHSFVLVLTSLLLSSGIGSYLSGRFPATRRTLMSLLGIVVAITLAYSLFLYEQFIDLMALPTAARFTMAVPVIVLPGLYMGMAFPVGMQIVRQSHPAFVPWGWGVNGAFSVLASIVAIVLSLNVGLKATLLMGVFCYLTALGLVATLREPATAGAGDRESAPVAPHGEPAGSTA